MEKYMNNKKRISVFDGKIKRIKKIYKQGEKNAKTESRTNE